MCGSVVAREIAIFYQNDVILGHVSVMLVLDSVEYGLPMLSLMLVLY